MAAIIDFPTKEVFKLQIPQIGIINKVLIYNQSRAYYGEIPASRELLNFMGSDNKVYVTGYVDRCGQLRITDIDEGDHEW